MESLAREVVKRQANITLGDISWGQFPDGFPNTFIRHVDQVRHSHVSFLACFDKPGTIFEQWSVLHTLAALAPTSLRILLPYFPTGTMERVDEEGQVATASTLAQMFSGLPPAGPGPIPLYLWDIHALANRHYFGPSISPRFKTGTKLLKEVLAGRNVSIVFPDDGARKRFKVMFLDENGRSPYPFVVCDKDRDGDKRDVHVSRGEARGCDVVIIDDLIHSGGTIIRCRDALLAAGARKVSVFVTHGVLENGSWKKFLDAGFEKVWVTDSCPSARDLDGKGPFRVLSLATSIANAILD